MVALQHVGAAAPGPVTPGSDEAPGLAGHEGFKGREQVDARDCAAQDAQRKRLATAQARAALLGLVLQQLGDGAYTLTGEAGRCATLASLQMAEALLAGIEHVRGEVAALLGQRGQR